MTADTYWHRQTTAQPLYDELLWSRPENRHAAGKLLVIGGNMHGFVAPAEAYGEANASGAGTVRVLMPDAIRKLVSQLFENVSFAPSNKSGSFAQNALAEWLDQAAWADSTLLAGDLGRNSETAIVIESFLGKYTGSLTITKDAADYAVKLADKIAARPNTTLVLNLAQLQKFCQNLKSETPIKFSMDLTKLVDALHVLSAKYPAEIVTKHLDNALVAVNGQVSTTKLDKEIDIWQVKTAAHAAVWRMQNPDKPFEAITTSLVA